MTGRSPGTIAHRMPPMLVLLLIVAALAAFMLLEKVVPAGHRVGQVAGVLLMTWGASTVAGAL